VNAPQNQIVVHPEQSSRTASVPEAPALQRSRARRNTGRRYPSSSRVCAFVWRVLYTNRRKHITLCFIEPDLGSEEPAAPDTKSREIRNEKPLHAPSSQRLLLHACLLACTQMLFGVPMHARMHHQLLPSRCIQTCTYKRSLIYNSYIGAPH
jgi:hypothetical protein